MSYLDLTGLEYYTEQLLAKTDETYATMAKVNSAVSEAISTVYKVMGSSTYDELPTDASVGDVYNITDDFELDGEGYPAGTNVVFTEDGWDALAGTIDLTSYATTDYVDSAIEGVTGVDLSDYATTAYVDEAIANVSVDVESISTTDIDNLFSALE